MDCGRIPMAIRVPNSGVRSKIVIMKVLTMLNVTITVITRKNSWAPKIFMSIICSASGMSCIQSRLTQSGPANFGAMRSLAATVSAMITTA